MAASTTVRTVAVDADIGLDVHRRAALAGLVCESPVFVVGSPRSGTTALARAMGEHSAFWVGQEGAFLSRLLGNRLLERVVELERADGPTGWMADAGMGDDEFFATIGVGISAVYASRAGGLRWIDHTPRHTALCPLLTRVLPGARFVHIVRDGRLVVHSLTNGKFRRRPWPFELAATRWAERVVQGADFVAAAPDRAIEIRNEDLEHRPRPTLAGVFAFLDEDDEPGPAAFASSRRVNSSFNGRFADERRSEPWLEWDREQCATFRSVAGAAMRRVGYPDDW